MTTTHAYQTHEGPYYQFPLRLNCEMAKKFTRISKATRINKSTLARDALDKHLADVERSGADKLINAICEV